MNKQKELLFITQSNLYGGLNYSADRNVSRSKVMTLYIYVHVDRLTATGGYLVEGIALLIISGNLPLMNVLHVQLYLLLIKAVVFCRE